MNQGLNTWLGVVLVRYHSLCDIKKGHFPELQFLADTF